MVCAVLALNAGNIREIDAKDAIQLRPEVKALGLIPAALIGRSLGSLRRSGLCCSGGRQMLQSTLDFVIDFGNQRLIVAEGRQGLSQGKQVFGTVITLERLCDRVLITLHSGMAEPSQSNSISFTGQDGIQYAKTAQPGDVVENAVNLQVHLIQRFLHVQHVLGRIGMRLSR